MEIITTMVRFNVPNEVLNQTTEKAQWFSFGPNSPYKDESIPLSKLSTKVGEKLTEVVMPKWVYKKSLALERFINDNYTEFSYKHNASDSEFFS